MTYTRSAHLIRKPSPQHLFPEMGTIVVMADVTMARLGSLAERRWGLFTTAQAEAVGVARKQLVRLTSAGVIKRVSHGVYRMAGAPPHTHESIYATWLALGGGTTPRTETGVAALVAGGVTAAVVHEIGDFLPDRLDFIVPTRKGTRLPDVRLRIRHLTPNEVVPVNGLPALTVERTIIDLIEVGTDTSLVTDALHDAVRQGKITAPERLRSDLTSFAARRDRYGSDVARLAEQLDTLVAPSSDRGDHD